MTRKLLWAFLAIGVVLVAMPLVISMPGKANAGESMIQQFEPIMQPANVETTVRYYEDVFVPLGQVAPAFNDQTVATFEGYLTGMSALPTEAQKLVGQMAASSGATPEQVQAQMAKEYPALSGMLQTMPQMQKDFGGMISMMKANTAIFSQVPAGLAHYKPLVETMQAEVDDYAQVSSLPDFNLFTVFFIVPGLLLIALAGFGLWQTSERHVRRAVTGGVPTPTH